MWKGSSWGAPPRGVPETFKGGGGLGEDCGFVSDCGQGAPESLEGEEGGENAGAPAGIPIPGWDLM